MICEGSSTLLFCSDRSPVRRRNRVSAVSPCFNTVSPGVCHVTSCRCSYTSPSPSPSPSLSPFPSPQLASPTALGSSEQPASLKQHAHIKTHHCPSTPPMLSLGQVFPHPPSVALHLRPMVDTSIPRIHHRQSGEASMCF